MVGLINFTFLGPRYFCMTMAAVLPVSSSVVYVSTAITFSKLNIYAWAFIFVFLFLTHDLLCSVVSIHMFITGMLKSLSLILIHLLLMGF